MAGINDEITAVLACPTTSFWLRQSLEQALTRDCVDAANDAEHLRNLLAARCDDTSNDTALLAVEIFVGVNTAEVVKHQYEVSSDNEREGWAMSIKTHIACGDRKDLEVAFPEWAGASPDNHN